MKNVIEYALVIIYASTALGGCSHSPAAVNLRASADTNSVRLSLIPSSPTGISEIIIYRSTYNLRSLNRLDFRSHPITKWIPTGNGTVVDDSLTAHNCLYYYYVKVTHANGCVAVSPVVSAVVPDVHGEPPGKGAVELLVDKVNYFVDVRIDKKTWKRYPINLGGDPYERKLHFDRLSTPEGRYRVLYYNPKSKYHKAVGIDYPNAADRRRYAEALEKGEIPSVAGDLCSIGGGIQIHGGGLGSNWTWGCIAMRNSDIDELFALLKNRTGIPIDIVGRLFTRDSLSTKGDGPARLSR